MKFRRIRINRVKNIGSANVLSLFAAIGIAEDKSQLFNGLIGVADAIVLQDARCNVVAVLVGLPGHGGHLPGCIGHAPGSHHVLPVGRGGAFGGDEAGVHIHIAVAVGQSSCALCGIEINRYRLAGRGKNGVRPDELGVQGGTDTQ